MVSCFFIRKRIDGALKAFETIIENIEKTGFVPNHLAELVDSRTIDVQNINHELSIDEQLAALNGENLDILLAKEANREQLEIAERIENYNAVLVQGPPGTGKTHTIANLLGHFLAQGKNILVTSYTKKALSVLKSQVPKEIQNLCVSVLDDTNDDMVRSIDGISEYLSSFTSNELMRKIRKTELKHELNKIVSNYDEIHLFLAAPAGVCIEVGRIIRKNMYPSTYVYNYQKVSKGNNYTRIFNLKEIR